MRGQGKDVTTSPLKIVKNLIKTQGFLHLYTGLQASLMRQVLYATIRMGLYRTAINHLKSKN